MCVALPGLSQQLSVRHYDVRDGLANSRVVAIQEDRKGYLWFGTWEGLSRFDGYGFTNYGTRDGLGSALINAIAEDRQGGLWVATNGGGVSRLLDGPTEFVARPHEPGSPRSKFESFPVADSPESNRVNALLFDSADNCWCAADDGLYRAAHKESGELRFELVVPHREVADFMAAFADSKGRLWFGIVDQIVEIVEGQIITYSSPEGVGQATITSIAQGANGEVLLANPRGVFEFIEPAQPVSRGLWRRFRVALKPNQIVHRMLLDSENALWLATQEGLIKYKESQTLYTTANGLSDNITISLATDRYGTLWIGTWSGGVCKLRGEMIVSFTRSEGLPDQHVLKVIEDRHGHIYAATAEGGIVEIVGGRAEPVPGSQEPPLGGETTCFVQDRRGDWWIGTNHGLFLFKGPELQLRHGKKFTAADGLPGGTVEELYEDSAGQMWISASDRRLYYTAPDGTARAHFKAGFIEAVQRPRPVTYIAGDLSGALWMGGRFGLMARLKNGTVNLFQPGDGLPETDTRALFLDSRGWLWIGLRSKCVSMTRNPSADLPDFVNYSTDSGLASAYVLSIAEDESGRMYLGTLKGLDRLDPLTGEIRHFSATDGLVGDVISHCMKDSRGNIWVATSTGLSMLNPRAEPAIRQPPPIYLSRVQIAGEDLRLPETGNLRMSAAELAASRNNLLIEFVGLDFRDEQEVRYRYKLEGAEADWSKPTFQRSVNYGRLGPGSYRFRVKAIDRSGTESLEPAMLEFRILPPIWQRWWFISAATLLVSCMVYAMHRNRLRRL